MDNAEIIFFSILIILIVINIIAIFYINENNVIYDTYLIFLVIIILLFITIIICFCVSYVNAVNNNISNSKILTLKSNQQPLEINIDNYMKNVDLFNLSVIKHNNIYLGLIRGHNKSKCYSYPCYIEINNNPNSTNIKMNLLDFNDKDFHSCNDNGIEDPRVFKYKNEHWGIANSLGHKEQKYKCINTMCIFKLSDIQNTFRLLYHPENPKLIQKNWSPFVYNDKLYCEYTINPHVIYEINTETGSINNIIHSDNNFDFNIKGGRLSGGTPAILITHFRTPVYLSIGHVRLVNNSYYHFFYIFENHPPFNIIGSSEIFKLDDKELIQFVSGLSIDGDELHVSYGVNDKFNKISVFNIYEINNKIRYDHKFINSLISKSLEKSYKLTIVIMETCKYLDHQELNKYCLKHNYNLVNYDYYIKNNPKDDRMILFLYTDMKNIRILNINYETNFDSIFNMMGNSKYICFEDSNNRFIHSSLLNHKDLYEMEDNYITSNFEDYLKVINNGYPYRKNLGGFIHKNYLNQILYGEKSILNDNVTIMPDGIRHIIKKNNTKIPKIIHQSFKIRLLPEYLSAAVHTWINLNPDYEYRYYDNGDRRKLIVDHFDNKVVKAYDMLINDEYRCDFWRFCVIYVYGGIYADIKTEAIFPLKNIIDSDIDYLFINNGNDNAMYNGFFGAKAKDHIIYKIIMTITKRILTKEYGSYNLYTNETMGSIILNEFGVENHMEVGKYKIKNYTVCVYNHYNDGNNERIILNENNNLLINTRHNTKILL